MLGRRKTVDLGLTPVGGGRTDDCTVEDASLSRRNMLLTLGAVGVAAAGASLGIVSYRDDAQAAEAADRPAARSTSGAAWSTCATCTGERKCVSVLPGTRHGLPPDQTWMRVAVLGGRRRPGVLHAGALPDVRERALPATSARSVRPITIRPGDRPGRPGHRASARVPAWRPAPTRPATSTGTQPAPTNRMPVPSPNTPQFPGEPDGHGRQVRAVRGSDCPTARSCRPAWRPALTACTTSATSSPTWRSTARRP